MDISKLTSQMTISQYVDNPYGKGATFVNVPAVKESLNKRYEALIDECKKFSVNVMKKGLDYYIIVEMPSESVKGVNYQVVMKLVPDDENAYKQTINDYYVQFYSNCPSFVFTYAYAFNTLNMLVPELVGKYDAEILENEPVIKNYYRVAGLEKSLYYACTYVLAHYNEKKELDKLAKKFSQSDLEKHVETNEDKMDEYKIKKVRQDKSEKREEKKRTPPSHTSSEKVTSTSPSKSKSSVRNVTAKKKVSSRPKIKGSKR